MSPTDYLGYYQLDTLIVEVVTIDDEIAAVFPGTPPGFEVKLNPTDKTDTFIMPAGPVAGAPLTFQKNEAGQVVSIIVGGEHTLQRLAELPPPPEVPTGQGLPAPQLQLDEEKEAAFAALVAQILEKADGAVLDYNLPYPKHEFLIYAAQQDKFIFHGSGKGDIDEFVTRRTSLELKDRSGRGNVQGIYGTHDGLWPLFFAIVDRGQISGAIRNGVSYFHNEAGEETAVYNFSINQDHLEERPYRTGTLYFLPRTPFRRLPATAEGGLSNEWVSEVPLKPLARLPIAPEEFPFLEQIGGHDDSELLTMQALGKKITEAAELARVLPDGYTLKLRWSQEVAETAFAYVPLLQNFFPTTRLALRFELDASVWFDFFVPPEIKGMMIKTLKERGVSFEAEEQS